MKNRSLILLALAVFLLSCSCFKTKKNNLDKSIEKVYGVEWKLVSINLPDEAIIPPVGRVTITFTEAGNVNGNGGCNRFSGKFEIKENKLSITDIMSTRRACEIMKVESAVIKALKDVDSFSAVGNQLLLKKGEEILLTYTK